MGGRTGVFSLEKYKMEGKKFYMQYMFDFLYSILYVRGVFLGNPLVDDSRRGRRWMALAALALSLWWLRETGSKIMPTTGPSIPAF